MKFQLNTTVYDRNMERNNDFFFQNIVNGHEQRIKTNNAVQLNFKKSI